MKHSTAALILGLTMLTTGANARDLVLECNGDGHYWGKDGNSPHSTRPVSATVRFSDGETRITVTNLPYHRVINAERTDKSDSYFTPVSVSLMSETYRSLQIGFYPTANSGLAIEARYQRGAELAAQSGGGTSAFQGFCVEKRS